MDWNQYPWLHGKLLQFFKEDYGWVQDWNAKNSKQEACNWDDDDACFFCLMAGIKKLYNESRYWPIVVERLSQVFKSDFWEGVAIAWNDQPDRTEQELFEFLEAYKL
jgi:hypothetical protein